MECFTGGHIPLAIVAILVVVFCILLALFVIAVALKKIQVHYKSYMVNFSIGKCTYSDTGYTPWPEL